MPPILPMTQEYYCKRTQRYPIGDYQRVTVVSPYRTGSTLLYNVLKFLFNDSGSLHNNNIVGKLHSPVIPGSTEIIFCPIRNPIDACFSRFRVDRGFQNQIINEHVLDVAVQDYLEQMKDMHNLLQKKLPNVVLLKYEDFASNLEAIFDKVEALFSTKIHEVDKALIKELFSKNNVKRFVEKYENFGQYDGATGFHGKHVDNGDEFSEDEKRLICEKIKEKLSGNSEFFEEYGYTF